MGVLRADSVLAAVSSCALADDRASRDKGLDACVVLLPNGVSAALQINSNGGAYAYQCEVLRAAVHAAWVPA